MLSFFALLQTVPIPNPQDYMASEWKGMAFLLVGILTLGGVTVVSGLAKIIINNTRAVTSLETCVKTIPAETAERVEKRIRG